MNKTLFSLTLSVLLILLLAGCGAPEGSNTGSDSGDANQGASQPGKAPASGNPLASLNREALPSYTAIFDIRFQGKSAWAYQLQSRKAPGLREDALHLEGVDQAQNPGDIRMVTDGASTRMIGPGTDNECVQFPNGQGMDPTLLVPESLVSWQSLLPALRLVGEEQLLGKTSLHYQGTGLTLEGWKDARVELWQEKATGALLRFSLMANGEDPYFNAGNGQLVARYDVQNLAAPAIQPVTGCELSVPLPNNAASLVRLPGLASFESSTSMDELSRFYQTALAQEEWALTDNAAQSETSAVLSYRRGAEELQVHIESTAAGGSKVRLFFMQGK